jgi:hypothetical protein
MPSAQSIIFIILVLLLMGGLVFMAMRMKSGSDSNVFSNLLGRSNPTSSLGSYRDSFNKPNNFFGGKGKNLLATVPTYGLVGFLFTFSLVAWSYMTNN